MSNFEQDFYWSEIFEAYLNFLLEDLLIFSGFTGSSFLPLKKAGVKLIEMGTKAQGHPKRSNVFFPQLFCPQDFFQIISKYDSAFVWEKAFGLGNYC